MPSPTSPCDPGPKVYNISKRAPFPTLAAEKNAICSQSPEKIKKETIKRRPKRNQAAYVPPGHCKTHWGKQANTILAKHVVDVCICLATMPPAGHRQTQRNNMRKAPIDGVTERSTERPINRTTERPSDQQSTELSTERSSDRSNDPSIQEGSL